MRKISFYVLTSLLMFFLLFPSCKKKKNPGPFDGKSGTFKDTRDGKMYKWVKIGEQIWMAENLNYTQGGNMRHIPDSVEWNGNQHYDGWAYYDNDANNGSEYGALYQWEAAKTACPQGWHLPTADEWNELISFVENDGHSGETGTALKSKNGWIHNGNGTDNYGFDIKPAGYRQWNGEFRYSGYFARFWTQTQTSNIQSNAESVSFYATSPTANPGTAIKTYGYSVRCVKD